MITDPQGLATASSAALFAMTFLFGRDVHPLRGLIRDRRVIVSFGAGVATAYLFMRMMPELAEAQMSIAQDALPGSAGGVIVYLAAMTGFLLVYGLDHFRRTAKQSAIGAAAGGEGGENVQGAYPYGMALYVLLLTYVLVEEPRASVAGTLLYAFAISFHFLAVDHTLRDEMGAAYDRLERFILAGMCVLGWGLSRLVDVPDVGVSLLLAFVSGGAIVNSAIMELPTERDGRFFPFVLGSLTFGVVLMTV